MDLETILQFLASEIDMVADLYCHPITTFRTIFSVPGTSSLSHAIPFAVVMLMICLAISTIMSSWQTPDTKNYAWNVVGTVAVWVCYGAVIHIFVRILGGGSGFKRTLAVYLYAQGLAQPLLAVCLAVCAPALGQIKDTVVTEATRLFALSGGYVPVLREKMLTPPIEIAYKTGVGAVILTYFCFGIIAAHDLSVARAVSATILAGVVPFCLFAGAYRLWSWQTLPFPRREHVVTPKNLHRVFMDTPIGDWGEWLELFSEQEIQQFVKWHNEATTGDTSCDTEDN